LTLEHRDMSNEPDRPRNIFSVDVEDYFHVEAFSDIVQPSTWGTYASRVETNTLRLLDLCDQWGVTGTFFILGWVADRNPELVRRIVARGHEPACHSYWHRLIYSLSPAEFREDTRRAKDCIEQAAGEPVYGYRAPSFSITAKSKWAPNVLAELGFQYDSSVFPIRHDTYGVPDAPRAPFVIPTLGGDLIEYPMSTFRFRSGPNLPVGGGGYLRILPYWYTALGFRRVHQEGGAVITYIHPWEIDPDQPRLPARVKSRLRHYTNLTKTTERLSQLVREHSFGPFRGSGLLPDVAHHWSL
jgi:polysaccharide deacetylase family protein (PEP-CTERM system associated)